MCCARVLQRHRSKRRNEGRHEQEAIQMWSAQGMAFIDRRTAFAGFLLWEKS